MIDSTIRLKQMNQPELSGFVVPIIQALLANTGSLTGIFYPLFQNPQNYAHSGDFISQVDLDSAVTQALSYVAQNFYPNSNPSGFSSGISSGGATGSYYPLNSNPSGYLNSGSLVPVFSGYNISLTGNQLFDQNNLLSLDYNNRLLWDFDGFSSLDWFNRYNLDFAGQTSVDWGARQLVNFQGAVVLDWFLQNLSGRWTGQYANFTSGLQVSGQNVLTGSLASFITTGQTGSFASAANLNATGSLLSAWTGASTGLYYPLNSNPQSFAHVTGNESVAGNKIFSNLCNFNGGIQMGDLGGGASQPITTLSNSDSIFLGFDILTTGFSTTAATVDWKNGLLSNNNTVNLNWMTKNLYGSWNIDSLTVSGNPVVTGGPYYLASNPSGYITSGQTGTFATTGNLNTTGANLSGLIVNNYLLSSTAASTYATIANLNATGTGIANWTGLSTGLYYPRTTNPSGYVTTGQTGGFVATGQTGVFATQTQVTTLNTWTGNSTGLYYPLNSNPLGYITSGQTGLFATTGNLAATGSTLAAWTGNSVGLYYPLNSNPSRYLSSFNSGAIPFIANGSIVIMPGYDVLTDAAGSPIIDAAGNYITQQTTGSLGVNQFNPQYTLDVGGSGNFSNGVYWSGNPVVTGGPYLANSTGVVAVSGNISTSLRTVSGVFSILTGNSIILVNTLASGNTGTFPNASGLIGTQFVVKDWKGNATGNNIIITGTNSQTFDGALSKTISSSYGSFTVVSDGQNWCII